MDDDNDGTCFQRERGGTDRDRIVSSRARQVSPAGY